MSKRYFSPLQDRLAIEMDPRLTESAGGIVFADITVASTKPLWGEIKAVGPECVDCKEGDRVYVPTTLGTSFRMGGREYIVIREAQILAVERDE